MNRVSAARCNCSMPVRRHCGRTYKECANMKLIKFCTSDCSPVQFIIKCMMKVGDRGWQSAMEGSLLLNWYCYQLQEVWSQYQALKVASCCRGCYRPPNGVSYCCQATRAKIIRRRLSHSSLAVKITSMSLRDSHWMMPLGSSAPQQSADGVWNLPLGATTSGCYHW